MKRPPSPCLRRIGIGIVALLAAVAVRAQTVYTWSGGDIVTGSISPTSVSVVGPSDTLNVTTGADHDFPGFTLTNNGTVSWQAGNLRSGNGGIINNNAAWNDSVVNNQINNAFGGAGTTFNNNASGTYTKTAGQTDFTIGFTNNGGTINVTGGTFNLDAGGTFSSGSVLNANGGTLQLLNGVLTMTGSITANNFLLNGGTVAGDQTFVNSTVNWQAGNFDSTNTTTIAGSSAINLISGNDHDFNQHAIVNNGTINWQAGNIRAGNGAVLTNNATWNDTVTNNQVNNAYGGPGGTTFINAAGATYNKTSGQTDFTIGFTNNGGTISVNNATLNLDAGGTFTDGTVLNATNGGTLQLTNGVLTMTGNITANNFLLNGGTVAGDQTFVNSTVNWQAGNLNSANTTTIAATSTLNLISGNDHDFSQHAIVNNGTINWQAGNIRSGNGGVITNNGVWNDSVTNNQMNNAYGGPGGTTFVNAANGLYSKTAGNTSFEVGFTNYGAVVVSGGTLSLDAGGTFYAGSSIGSTGTGVVQLTNGVLQGAGGGFNATNFLLTGGQVAGDITFLGTTNWVASNFNNPTGTATIGGILNITSGNDHNFDQHQMVNNGTVNWTDGNIRAGDGGVFTNNAVWNDSVVNNQINDAYNGPGGTTFHNAAGATYNKTAGTTLMADGVLVNDGTINVSGGTLNLVGGTLNDGSSIGSTGGGVVQLINGTLTANGTVNVQNFVLSGGTLQGAQALQGSSTWLATSLNTLGTTTIPNGSVFSIDSGNDHNFDQHQIVNNGSVAWINGNIRSGDGGVFANHGTFTDTVSNNQINGAYGGPGGATFLNAVDGVYNKTTGTTLMADGVLVNDGIINVTGGTLSLSGGTLESGSVTMSSGPGVVQLVSGALNVAGAVTTQNFQLAGGQLVGSQIFEGSLTWLATDLNTSGTTIVGPGALFNIDSGNDHNFNGRAVVNTGNVDWIAGNLRSGNGGTISNYGLWTDTAGNNQLNNAYGGTGGTTFLNAVGGTYDKAGGTTNVGVPFVNLGTLKVSGGSLTLSSGYSDAAGVITLGSGATLASTTALSLSEGSLLDGNGTFSMPGLSISGAIKPGDAGTTGQLLLSGPVTLLAPAFTEFLIGGTTQVSQYDHLVVNGSLTLGGALEVSFANGFQSSVNSGMTFDLISANSLSNSFQYAASGTRIVTADGLGSFVVNYGPGSNFGVNDVVLTDFAPVPEPSTWAMFLAGAGMLGFFVRRRRA